MLVLSLCCLGLTKTCFLRPFKSLGFRSLCSKTISSSFFKFSSCSIALSSSLTSSSIFLVFNSLYFKIFIFFKFPPSLLSFSDKKTLGLGFYEWIFCCSRSLSCLISLNSSSYSSYVNLLP